MMVLATVRFAPYLYHVDVRLISRSNKYERLVYVVDTPAYFIKVSVKTIVLKLGLYKNV